MKKQYTISDLIVFVVFSIIWELIFSITVGYLINTLGMSMCDTLWYCIMIVLIIVLGLVYFLHLFNVRAMAISIVSYVILNALISKIVFFMDGVDLTDFGRKTRVLLAVISFVCSVLLYIYEFRKVSKKIIRNNDYIKEVLGCSKTYAPAISRDQLKNKIFGGLEKDKEPVIWGYISSAIDGNVNGIKKFLEDESDDGSNVLFVNSGWGTGKTTYTLIAIDEADNKNRSYRYIYESAFKYSGSIDEYINDILSTLENTLLEFNVLSKDAIRSIIKNLETDPSKIFINILKMDNYSSLNRLTSESILELNNKYNESSNSFKVVLIIDDIDRVQSKDLIQILSLLSVMRRLSFIKIIIPADLSIIRESLAKGGVINSDGFVEKYLPSPSSISISNNYHFIEETIIAKIHSLNPNLINASPAIAAIYIKLLSDELINQVRQNEGYNDVAKSSWFTLGSDVSIRDDRISSPNNRILATLLDSVRDFQRHNEEEFSVYHKKFDGYEYEYGKNGHTMTRLHDIVYDLRNRGRFVISGFTNEDYVLISKWIFIYMEENWNIFHFSIRKLLEIVNSIDFERCPNSPNGMFANVMNSLFPNEKQIKPLD